MKHPGLVYLIIPLFACFAGFFLLPMARLILTASTGPQGLGIYWEMITTARYLTTLGHTLVLSAGVTLATLVIATISGLFLQRNAFPGRRFMVAS